jgi:hypothetical protein
VLRLLGQERTAAVAAEDVQKLEGCMLLSKVSACKLVERFQGHGEVGGLRLVIYKACHPTVEA